MRHLFLPSLLFSLFFFSLVKPVSAAEYFISPSGNDTNNGISQSSPIKTFIQAWQILYPGDTLWLMDGLYYQTLAPNVRNGSPNSAINTNDYNTFPLDHPDRLKNFIKVKALNDGMAIIDGQYQRPVISLGWEETGNWNLGHYFLIEGIIGKNSNSSVFKINTKNVVLRRNSGYNANPHGNYHVFDTWAGGDATTPANILMEDNIAAGSGRKMMLTYVSYNNVVVRRNFAAWQYWLGDEWCGSPWPQTDGIENYPARGGDQPIIPNNSIFENNINFGLTAHIGISFSPNTGKRYGNRYMGNMALGSGMRWNNNLKQFESKKFDGGPLIDVSGTNCTYNDTAKPLSCSASTCQLKMGSSRDGLGIGYFETPYMENNEFKDNFAAYNAGMGLNAGPFDSTSINNILHYNSFILNGLGNPVPNQAGWPSPNYDTTTSNLSQFSTLGNLNIGKIWNSANFNFQPGTNPAPGVGASLQYRYNIAQKTAQSLWPWPMEARIKKEFADPTLFQADGVQGRVWTNFSVTEAVCNTILLPNGAVSSCSTTISPTNTPLPGDINGDRVVNILDYTLLSNNFGTNNTAADINDDGIVNILDYTILSNNFGSSG